MQRNDRERWPEEFDPEQNRSRQSSRRNSASSTSRRNSLKKEKTAQKIPNTAHSTPKRNYQKRDNPESVSSPKKINQKRDNLDFVVTGKQILKMSDRANSLPGSYFRRPSTDSMGNSKLRTKNPEVTRRNNSQSSRSRDTSVEDEMSLDLSQISDFEDTNAKYGIKKKFAPAVTSTPKPSQKTTQKPKSGFQTQKIHKSEDIKKNSFESSIHSTFSCSRDSYKTSSSASPYKFCRSTELDYSSASPEYSGQSSTELSPRVSLAAMVSPISSAKDVSPSSCYRNWIEANHPKTKVYDKKAENGEWNNFWANYNNSISTVPLKSYYDQCPTPYRTENIELTDLEYSTEERTKSPENLRSINNIIRNEGLQLTPRETQNIIKCAHILGNVLSKAIDRMSIPQENRVKELDREVKKKNMKLELREQNEPLKVTEERKSETVTTQTDISLPNTKSAPKIFESILRQLSKSSNDENAEKIKREEKKEDIEE